MKKALPDHSGSAFFKTTVVHLSDFCLCGSGLARDGITAIYLPHPIACIAGKLNWLNDFGHFNRAL